MAKLWFSNYQSYLESELWQSIKDEFDTKTSMFVNACLFCGKISDQLDHHHWRYPKYWSDDHYGNLIKVCNNCHKSIHDIQNSHPIKWEDLLNCELLINYIAVVNSVFLNQGGAK